MPILYGVGAGSETIFVKLVNLNVDTKECVTWEDPGGFPSEAVFVKALDGKDEDDGVVMSSVMNIPGEERIFGKLVKLNVETKECVMWEDPAGFPSEPVFVKAPDGKEEDDGVILSSVMNIPGKERIFGKLFKLNVKTKEEPGVCFGACVCQREQMMAY